MSVFFKPREEQRAVTSLPFNYPPKLVYSSQETALSLTPVFAANRHITDFGSTLPLKGYRKDNDRRVPMGALPQLFKRLEDRGELVPWLAQAFMSLVLRGNAVGLATELDGFGFPLTVEWLPMERVEVNDGVWYVDGRRTAKWPNQIDDRAPVVHVPWIVPPGEVLGLSPIAYFASTIGAGLSAQQYGGDWFAGGGFPPAVFKNIEKTVPAKVADDIRNRLKRALLKREPLVHGNDWEFTPVSVPPSEAAFIESQKLTANQIASIYGIAPEECGGEPAGSLTYINEEMRQTVRAHNLRPYLVRFERAFASWIPGPQYMRFNVDAIVRADIKTRFEVYEIQNKIGFASVDEQRATEDLPPLPNGAGAKAVPATATQSQP